MACVVVTGAAGALGSVLVARLAAAGSAVAAMDSARSAARLEALAKSAASASASTSPSTGRVVGIVGDVASPSEWTAALARIDAEIGPPSGAVLIAGGWKGGAPLHEAKDDVAWDAMLRANLETAYRSLRAVLPGMVERKAGSIVVIGTRAVERPWTSGGAAEYAATKSAVVALAQTVAEEVRQQGVRVNAVLPSTIDTPANRSAMPDADPSRWVSAESLSDVIAFLLSDASRDVSGAALPVYGRA